jgi:hypothetical protein
MFRNNISLQLKGDGCSMLVSVQLNLDLENAADIYLRNAVSHTDYTVLSHRMVTFTPVPNTPFSFRFPWIYIYIYSPIISVFIFHIPDFMSLFLSLGSLYQECIQRRSPFWQFTTSFCLKSSCKPDAQHQVEEPSIIGCSRLLSDLWPLAAGLHIWRPSPPSVSREHAVIIVLKMDPFEMGY